MNNKKLIFFLLALFCVGITISSVSAIEDSNSTDDLTIVDESNSTDSLNAVNSADSIENLSRCESINSNDNLSSSESSSSEALYLNKNSDNNVLSSTIIIMVKIQV